MVTSGSAADIDDRAIVPSARMSMRIAAPLLALIGHELRAPAGVVGGYLALLEHGHDTLTPEQQKALAGARRAQQSLVEALDDLRRLTTSWRAEHDPLTWIALPLLGRRGASPGDGAPPAADARSRVGRQSCRAADATLPSPTRS